MRTLSKRSLLRSAAASALALPAGIGAGHVSLAAAPGAAPRLGAAVRPVLDGDSLQRRTRASLSAFVDWCAEYRVRGCIGETGVPRGQGGPSGDGLRWAELLRQTIAYLTANEISALLWAADSCLGAD